MTVAEVALEAASSVDEWHVRAHVGLASVAADWTQLPKVNDWQRFLWTRSQGDDNNIQRFLSTRSQGDDNIYIGFCRQCHIYKGFCRQGHRVMTTYTEVSVDKVTG